MWRAWNGSAFWGKRLRQCGGLGRLGRLGHVGWRRLLGLPSLLGLVSLFGLFAMAACGPTSTKNGGGRDGAVSSDASGSDALVSDAGGGDSGTPQEICNGLDDNSDGLVDEGCPCENEAEQACYPAPHTPPEGCQYGTQVCSEGTWGGPCEGAKVPPVGAAKCCRILEDEDNPAHEVLDQCVSVYPTAQIPQCMDIAAWSPSHVDCTFSHVTSNVADEFVDKSRGGVTVANVAEGRAYTRQVALDDFGVAEADILHEVSPAVEIEGTTGCDPGGRGFAWGSILYRTSLGAVGELVYLYVGICKDNCDAEAFLRSAEPLLVCSEGTVL